MLFKELNLKPELAEAVEKNGFKEMTPIQEKALPFLLEGDDLIGLAPTGTGKTLAYALPLLSKIDYSVSKPQALVLCPTRELAMQIVQTIDSLLGKGNESNVLAVYGGTSINNQFKALKLHPRIIVACPGRLNDHLDRGTIKLDRISTLVLDECDEMVGMGFMPDVDKIISHLSSPHQTSLFSATTDKDVEKAAKKYMKDPKRVSVSLPTEDSPKLIKQYFIKSEKDEKLAKLKVILDNSAYDRAFIFCRTKHNVDHLTAALLKKGYKVSCIHGDLKQKARERNLLNFRTDQTKILVATDIAARGLDISDVDTVINYSLPDDDEFYLHRIGRTGRAKRAGQSFTFFSAEEMKMKSVYEKLTQSKMEEFVVTSDSIEAGKAQDQQTSIDKIAKSMKKYIKKNDLSLYQKEIPALLSYLQKTNKNMTVERLGAALLKMSADLHDKKN